MTWGMHAIGHLELGQEEEAARMFDKSYLPYVQVTIQPLDISHNSENPLVCPCVTFFTIIFGSHV